MGFTQAVRSFWSNYATFKGRARRSEYWFITLFLLLTNLAAAGVDLALMQGDVEQFLANGGGGIVGLVWLVATILPAVAVLVRRLHDTGRTGWLLLGLYIPVALLTGLTILGDMESLQTLVVIGVLALVAFVFNIVILVFTVLNSTPEENQYGASPKAVAA
jgi:uncharacterized membrane protein YhaH (DUF805 family)